MEDQAKEIIRKINRLHIYSTRRHGKTMMALEYMKYLRGKLINVYVACERKR